MRERSAPSTTPHTMSSCCLDAEIDPMTRHVAELGFGLGITKLPGSNRMIGAVSLLQVLSSRLAHLVELRVERVP
jgi:hypothetical protein